jgi:hypothetical protein
MPATLNMTRRRATPGAYVDVSWATDKDWMRAGGRDIWGNAENEFIFGLDEVDRLKNWQIGFGAGQPDYPYLLESPTLSTYNVWIYVNLTVQKMEINLVWRGIPFELRNEGASGYHTAKVVSLKTVPTRRALKEMLRWKHVWNNNRYFGGGGVGVAWAELVNLYASMVESILAKLVLNREDIFDVENIDQ